MFGTIFQQITGLLDKRFVLNAFFPAALLSLGLVVIWEASGEGVGAGVVRLTGLDAASLAALAIFAVAIVFVIATLLASQTATLVAWMEGTAGPLHWPFFAKPGRSWWEKQQPGPDTDDPPFSIPREGKVAPTALGTLAFANAEYARRNYGMDIADIWPRLAPLLSDALTGSVVNAETAIEQLVGFSTTAVVFGLVAGGVVAYHRAPLLVCALVPVASFALAAVLYRALVAAAVQWSQVMRTGIDLHRFDLLDVFHVPAPRTSAEERAEWSRLSAVLRAQDTARPLGFVPPKTP
jgi:hypothetical protein